MSRSLRGVGDAVSAVAGAGDDHNAAVRRSVGPYPLGSALAARLGTTVSAWRIAKQASSLPLSGHTTGNGVVRGRSRRITGSGDRLPEHHDAGGHRQCGEHGENLAHLCSHDDGAARPGQRWVPKVDTTPPAADQPHKGRLGDLVSPKPRVQTLRKTQRRSRRNRSNVAAALAATSSASSTAAGGALCRECATARVPLVKPRASPKTIRP